MRSPKMLKVMFNGEYMCHVYPHASKFQVFKYHVAKGMRVAMIIGLISIAVTGGIAYGESKTEVAYAFNDQSGDMFKIKIEGLKDKVVADLMKCESAGATEGDGLVVYDPLVSNPSATSKRNIPSFGLFQFKKDTVIHYYKMKTGKTLTPKEAVLLALDKEDAASLAKFVGFETKSKFGKDWVNCSKKHNLDQRVDLIKSLEV